MVKTFIESEKKTLWPLFMDGVQLPQGYSHFEKAVYFLPFSQRCCFMHVICHTP